jgi:hypothetical protein
MQDITIHETQVIIGGLISMRITDGYIPRLAPLWASRHAC